MDFFVQHLVGGLSIGFLYGLSAMGFVMIFKSSSVLNFAHGELLALGAYVFLALFTWLKLPLLTAFLIALAGCFVFGMLVLLFVGAKLILMAWKIHIPIGLSLAIVVAILAGGVLLSLLLTRREGAAKQGS